MIKYNERFKPKNLMSDIIQKKEQGINHIKKLSFNRRASSIGENRAINYIEDQLRDEGIESKRDYFEWTGPIRILIRIGYFILIINLIIFRQILIVIIFFIIKVASIRVKNMSLIPKEKSKNLYSSISSKNKNGEKKPLIIFTAHYDSISVILPYRAQIFIFLFYRIMSILYIGIIVFLLFSLFTGFFDPAENFVAFIMFDLILSIFSIFIAIPIIIIAIKDESSSGSVDNASGVAVTLELNKLFHKYPLENYDLLFLWAGAEEWGMRGSKHFCKKYFGQFRKSYDLNKSININIDMVGTYIGLITKTGLFKKRRDNIFNKYFISLARKMNINIECYSKLFKIKSDHRSFEKISKKNNLNFQTSCIHSDRDSKYIHSSKDTPDKCSKEIINNCIRLCYFCVKEIDSKTEIKK